MNVREPVQRPVHSRCSGKCWLCLGSGPRSLTVGLHGQTPRLAAPLQIAALVGRREQIQLRFPIRRHPSSFSPPDPPPPPSSSPSSGPGHAVRKHMERRDVKREGRRQSHCPLVPGLLLSRRPGHPVYALSFSCHSRCMVSGVPSLEHISNGP